MIAPVADVLPPLAESLTRAVRTVATIDQPDADER
jgi:hypothetical protein